MIILLLAQDTESISCGEQQIFKKNWRIAKEYCIDCTFKVVNYHLVFWFFKIDGFEIIIVLKTEG